jgi:hypothetical protein
VKLLLDSFFVFWISFHWFARACHGLSCFTSLSHAGRSTL